ncbi:MAG: RNA polymerase sigma factor [Rhodopirellula sp.]|nr:RNA polymerase sigma factor [Rhodopirellula sp.]
MRTPDDIHDELLVIRCQDGDREALAELVDRWQPKLLRQAMRLTGTADSAADVIQETWVAIVRGIRRLDDPAAFRDWAYRILTHKSADWVRDRQRRRATGRPLAVEPVETAPATEDSSDDVTALRNAIKLRPNQQKTILGMFYLDGMPVRLIAEVLSLPEGTVKSRLYHARCHLKEVLERRKP